jgi:hypothetical protein
MRRARAEPSRQEPPSWGVPQARSASTKTIIFTGFGSATPGARVPGVRAADLGSPVFLRALFVGGLQLTAFVTLDALPGGLFGATRLFLWSDRIILVVARPRGPALRVAVAPPRHRTTPL